MQGNDLVAYGGEGGGGVCVCSCICVPIQSIIKCNKIFFLTLCHKCLIKELRGFLWFFGLYSSQKEGI